MSQPHFGAKCENATHTPKSGKMEFSGTPKNSEDNLRGQISLHWCVLYINGKLLKCRCPKWHCMGHLDICSPSYGQKKGLIPGLLACPSTPFQCWKLGTTLKSQLSATLHSWTFKWVQQGTWECVIKSIYLNFFGLSQVV